MNGNKEHWKSRALELEEILVEVNKALVLVPVHDMKLGHTWLPSDEALRLLERAKATIKNYVDGYWSNGPVEYPNK